MRQSPGGSKATVNSEVPASPLNFRFQTGRCHPDWGGWYPLGLPNSVRKVGVAVGRIRDGTGAVLKQIEHAAEHHAALVWVENRLRWDLGELSPEIWSGVRLKEILQSDGS